MNITKLTDKYAVRILEERDVSLIYNVAIENPMYYEYCPPFVTAQAILDDMQALPPKKTLDDKYYVGYFDGDVLVAVMDLIDGYPNKETAFIGFFMMNKQYQGKGLGSSLIEDCCDCLKEAGFQYVRLGFVKGNAQSEHFWIKNGFERTGVEAKQELYTVVVLQKEI